MLDTAPADCIHFSFADGQVESVTIDSDWHTRVEPDSFGANALLAFVEANAAATTPSFQPQSDFRHKAPAHVKDELVQQMMDLGQRAFDLMDRALTGTWDPPEPGPPEEVSDPHRHVVVTVLGGAPVDMQVNTARLKTDVIRIEEAMKVALNLALAQTGETNPLMREVAELRAELRRHEATLNDYRELS